MTIIKNVAQQYAKVGDVVEYSLSIMNEETDVIYDVTVSDVLASELEFVLNSVQVGNQVVPGANIITGVKIGSLQPKETKEITFRAKVISGDSTTIQNQAEGVYTVRTNNGTLQQCRVYSYPVLLEIVNVEVDINKTANRSYLVVGEELTYTVTLTNSGNITAENVIFSDDLPSEVELVQGTFNINGRVVNQVEIDKGINISNIAPGANATVGYTVKLVDTECQGWIYNQAYAKFNYTFPDGFRGEMKTAAGAPGSSVQTRVSQLMINKLPYQTYARVGEVVEYTLQVTNLGVTDLENVIVNDILPEQLEFVKGSVKVEAQTWPDANIVSGINLGTLTANQIKTITFVVKVISNQNMPISNIAEATYIQMGGECLVQNACCESNEAILNVSNPHLKVQKTADTELALLGDIITYTVTIFNDGDLNAYNVFFRDHLPKEVVLIPGSFSINGKKVNEVEIDKGINIGDIPVKGTSTIQYQVKVVCNNCQGFITNCAHVDFYYNLPNGCMGKMETEENECLTIMLAISTFKQLTLESYLCIPEVKPNIEAINSMTGTIDILNSNVISTPQIISVEGQKLTGYKLIVRGVLQLVIEYTALDECQSVHSAHYAVPFSTFIILPECYTVGSKIQVNGAVENICYRALDIRNFFANTTALINAKILGL